MSGNRYKSSAGSCCPQSGYNSPSYGASGCCPQNVQAAPQPCCESHSTVVTPAVCFKPTQNVVAANPYFFISFENDCEQQIPIHINEIFFYHTGAGKLNIVGKQGGAYQLTVADPLRAGIEIRREDCVFLYINPDAAAANTNRCLLGQFYVPVVNGEATISIQNGTSIPIGSTLSFVWQGQIGSYTVTDFLSAEGTTYGYTVTNVGNGHTPGIIIDGGVVGTCPVPIELITIIDLCNLAPSNVADHIAACVNGAPIGFKPGAANDTIVGLDDLTWGLGRVSGLDCCVIVDECVKFSGQVCPSLSDTVKLKVGFNTCILDRFDEAFDNAQNLAANINGFPINITNIQVIDGSTYVTVQPAGDNNITIPLNFDAGASICLGDCCAGCNLGPGSTNVKAPLFGIDSPLQGIGTALVTVPIGVSHWLVGLDNTTPQTIEVLQLTAPYFAAPGPNGPIIPKYSDPMIFRQKVCNNSPKGCNQLAELQLNVLLALDPLPADSTVDWEFAHYADDADTLENGLANPFDIVSTQQKIAGRLEGPSVIDAVLLNTSFGNTNIGGNKVFPYGAGDFRDYLNLTKCNCALSIVWLFLRIDTPSAIPTLNIFVNARRHFKFFDDHMVDMPLNTPQTSGWA